MCVIFLKTPDQSASLRPSLFDPDGLVLLRCQKGPLRTRNSVFCKAHWDPCGSTMDFWVLLGDRGCVWGMTAIFHVVPVVALWFFPGV
jgi:hypothetical protein